MKTKWIILCFYLTCAALLAAPNGTVTAPALKPVGVGSAPLYFITNAGQTDAKALFYAPTPGYTLWLTREGLIFDRVEKDQRGEPSRSVTELVFKDANKDFEVRASDPSDYRVSYFFGSDESEWKTDIPTSKAVLYKNLYDGIDLKVYGAGDQIEYDWIVGPGARPEQIRFAYTGGQKTGLARDGNLAVETSAGRILHRRPRAHQVIAGRRVDVEAAFRETGKDEYGFRVGTFDSRHELTIDPLVLAYATYLGGHEKDRSFNMTVDPTGAVYLCGSTLSRDFPPVSQTLPREDIFVTKMSPDGKSLVYTAFFPSVALPEFMTMGIYVDAKGFVYLSGGTKSSKFPIKNAFQSKFGGGEADGFILKLARSGKSLVYSSYIGGTGDECCTALRVDANGAAYLGGYTDSPNFPTKKAFQKKFGGRFDAFVAKVVPQGSSLVYSSFLGPSGTEACAALAVDAEGAVTIAGITDSRNFPIKAAFQKAYGGGDWDGFVTRLSPAGDSLVNSSYLGGLSEDWPCDMTIDASGAVYVVGFTTGSFPLKKAFQKTRAGGYDAFVTKIEPNRKAILYSSYLGGGGRDMALGITVDKTGAAYIVGETTSRNFPIKTPYQADLHGSQDGFLSVVDPTGLKILYSTYVGGIYREYAYGIALDAGGAVYLCGETNSPDFPVLGPYQKALKGDYDAFVVKFSQGAAGRSK